MYKRIIPCLDIDKGRVVKGINFEGIKDVGDPVERAILYEKQGADEIVFLDITATTEDRGTIADAAKRATTLIKTPITVGGGIRALSDIEPLLEAGVTKVSINSAAVKNPQLVKQAADAFGSRRIVVAVDVRKKDGQYVVLVNGGKAEVGLLVVDWVKQLEGLGAGEILLTSMDADGTKDGYDIAVTALVSESVKIPVIASGGCGKLADFLKVFKETNCSAALAASLFHYGELTVSEVKNYLHENNVPVRL